MTPEAKDEITKRIALQLQVALTAWQEIYPEDTDADACAKSLDIVEFEIEDFLTRPDPPAPVKPVVAEGSTLQHSPEPTGSNEREGGGHAEEATGSDRSGRGRKRGALPFRQMLIEIGREFPDGLDISTIVAEAQARGWNHPNPRGYVSVTASQLVRGGLLVRRERGRYTLSPAFMGKAESDDDESER